MAPVYPMMAAIPLHSLFPASPSLCVAASSTVFARPITRRAWGRCLVVFASTYVLSYQICKESPREACAVVFPRAHNRFFQFASPAKFVSLRVVDSFVGGKIKLCNDQRFLVFISLLHTEVSSSLHYIHTAISAPSSPSTPTPAQSAPTQVCMHGCM